MKATQTDSAKMNGIMLLESVANETWIPLRENQVARDWEKDR